VIEDAFVISVLDKMAVMVEVVAGLFLGEIRQMR